MIRIQPVLENDCPAQTKAIYDSIRETFPIDSVPSVFKYLAAFPNYLSYVWNQIRNNIEDQSIRNYINAIEEFAALAMDQIYQPSELTFDYLSGINSSIEKKILVEFSQKTSQTNACLYFFSLAIRESLKGKYLGLKQIGGNFFEKEDFFSDLSEDFHDFSGKKITTLETKLAVSAYNDIIS